MMDELETRGGALETQLDRLEGSLAGAGDMVSQFDAELSRMRRSMAETNAGVTSLSNSISRGLRQAFDGLVFDGLKASDALELVGKSIINATYSAAIRPVTDRLGGILGAGLSTIGAVAGFSDGGAFTQGRVTPFAKGGVVTRATTFPMRGGTGLMGEAGPEAILPLSRGADGSLGVRSEGSARAMNVIVNVSTPDVAGFQRSQGQIAAQMGRALARGQRNR